MADNKGRDTGDYQGRFMAEADPGLTWALEKAARSWLFAAGQDVPAAGTLHPGGPLLVIRHGYVASVAEAADGRRWLLSIRGAGDLVGRQCGLFPGPRGKHGTHGQRVRALTDGYAWSLRQDHFREILAHHPQGWKVLAYDLHELLEDAEERIAVMAGADAQQRLAVFVLQLLTLKSPDGTLRAGMVPIPLAQAEIGEWIGATRETVEKILARWRGRGAVRTGRRSLEVLDVAHLEKIASAIRRPTVSRAAQTPLAS
jgi:CRP-like cAMP-binding protein